MHFVTIWRKIIDNVIYFLYGLEYSYSLSTSTRHHFSVNNLLWSIGETISICNACQIIMAIQYGQINWKIRILNIQESILFAFSIMFLANNC